MNEAHDSGRLRTVLRIVFRRWSLFVLASALFAICALAGAHFVPPSYTGEAVFVRRMDAASETARESGESFQTNKLTLQQELAGQTAIRQAAEELGLTRGLPRTADGQLTSEGLMGRQELVRKLAGAVKVQWEVRSDRVDRVSVSFTDRDPVLAEKMPNLLISNYVSLASQQVTAQLRASEEFLEKEVERARSLVDAQVKKQLDFETLHQGKLPDSPGQVQEQIQKLETDIGVRRMEQSAAAMEVARGRAVLDGLRTAASRPTTMTSQPTLETVGPNPQYRELEEELRRVTNTLEDARGVAEMTSKHPSVLELEKKIASLKQRLETTPKEITLHRTYAAGSDIGTLSLQLFAQRRDEIIMQLASAQSRVELADAEMKRLNAHLEGYMKLMAEFGPLRQEYLQILKERDDAQAKLKVWEDRSSPIQMALAAEVANRRTQYDTVQNADTQFRPSFPTLPMVLGFALLGGLAFGGGLVFLMNAMDRSVTTPEEAAHCFGLPILGSIGEIVTPRQKAMRRLRNATVIPAVSLVLAVCLSLSVLSVVLWLQYPEHFKRWKAGPMSFVAKQVLGTAEGGR